ncbi:MAG: cell division protein WhiA [Petroclostridium sp.]|uniref:DNA-binding protein WhiA n=1 Tax=Petroclostridium xylanilyticum TaxID=1792311 RepID=UPI000B999078|nr:DNA-binding protein WhiA [Petroclostridium xylanilyticum]MBZ4646614.1 whiA [Clostridia bacterium]MDK2810611.1 cell division protein WhiA [Petroclostridium sp.]
MSFSSRTKNELCRLEKDGNCCCIAELAGIICFAGIIKNGTDENYLKISTENASVARRVFNLTKWTFGVHTIINIKKNRSPKHMNSYSLYVKDKENLSRILKELRLISSGGDYENLICFRINNHMVDRECCKKAFIRGAFLGGGSITDPESTYHLELVTHHYLLSKDVCDLLGQFDLQAKTILRKSNYVIYFKGSENIVDFLNIIGAHKSLMELENIRIMKEMRNNVNRMVNCETANLEKTVNASLKQIQNIEFIQNTLGLEKLPAVLQEIARLRLEYKEASLKELGEMLHPPIGKSGVNHRLRKLQNIAENLQNAHKK